MSLLALMVAATTLAGLLPPTPSPPPPGLTVGKPAPAFFVTGLDGRLTGSGALHGRALVVQVFTSSCAPCRDEIANIVSAYPRYRESVRFIGIDEREPASTVARLVRKLHVPYEVGIDAGRVAAALSASSLPQTVFIDSHGIVRAVTSGPLGRVQLERQLALIAGD